MICLRVEHAAGMRTHPILLLALGLSLSACDDPGGPGPDGPSTGTLVVSTSTAGDDPDRNGYLLTVDDIDSLGLAPTGTAHVDLASGGHTLRLLGVATHCSVAPGSTVEVDIQPGDTTPVAFGVDCPATGARVTVTTNGLDRDPDGYRVLLDGSDHGAISSNGTALIRGDPGSRTIALAGLAPNCAVEGSALRTVTIVEAEVTRIEVVVVCTATSGVIEIVMLGNGAGALFEVMLDGATLSPTWPAGFEYAFYGGVPPGDHLVSLTAPEGCSVEPDRQSVAVTAGGLIRDTVEVTFSAACVWNVRIIVTTTGTIPTQSYEFFSCVGSSCWYDYRRSLGTVRPNGTLLTHLAPGTYHIYTYLPANCSSQHNIFTEEFTVLAGHTLDIEWPIVCSP